MENLIEEYNGELLKSIVDLVTTALGFAFVTTCIEKHKTSEKIQRTL